MFVTCLFHIFSPLVFFLRVEGLEHSGVNLYEYSMRWEKVKFSGMIKETADKTDSDHTEWGIYENDKS